MKVWVHVGPDADRADDDHKASPVRGVSLPPCRHCGGRIEKVDR